ncbi:MAG: TetR/AcrR family transcriptional regulator [Proteobacteria bacterium]|nr:TetR/AcrR family transcriptional regulator [Pseudomonadota bacterium]
MGVKERRQREREERKIQILKAAKELLHQKGINGASMNQIAKKAELGVATLYSYFKNKDDLFLTIQQEGLELLKERTLKKIGKEEDPREKLRKIALAYLEFSQERKNYYYIINYFTTVAEIVFTPTLKAQIDQQAKKSLRITKLVIEEGIEKSVFRETNPNRCSIMFWALVNGLTQYKKFETTILKDDTHLDIFKFAIDNFIKMLV